VAATKTLLQLRNAVVSGAAIDGQTGASGRHPAADLNERINRYIEAVRSLVRGEGGELGQALTDIDAIPAATANEDFIELDWPTTAEEVTGVDVLVPRSPRWQPLDAADWSQRRALNFERSYPSGGVGWWTVKSLPEARASASVTAGKLALFPADLSGSYRIAYVEQWTPMTADTHVWAYHANWDTWVINAVVMELTQRDSNKKGLFALAERNFLRAEERIKAASGRIGAGFVVPTRAGGEWV
jgi:class 3 adenylate cyclase